MPGNGVRAVGSSTKSVRSPSPMGSATGSSTIRPRFRHRIHRRPTDGFRDRLPDKAVRRHRLPTSSRSTGSATGRPSDRSPSRIRSAPDPVSDPASIRFRPHRRSRAVAVAAASPPVPGAGIGVRPGIGIDRHRSPHRPPAGLALHDAAQGGGRTGPVGKRGTGGDGLAAARLAGAPGTSRRSGADDSVPPGRTGSIRRKQLPTPGTPWASAHRRAAAHPRGRWPGPDPCHRCGAHGRDPRARSGCTPDPPAPASVRRPGR